MSCKKPPGNGKSKSGAKKKRPRKGAKEQYRSERPRTIVVEPGGYELV